MYFQFTSNIFVGRVLNFIITLYHFLFTQVFLPFIDFSAGMVDSAFLFRKEQYSVILKFFEEREFKDWY